MDYNEHPMDISSGCEFQWAFSEDLVNICKVRGFQWTLVDKIFSPPHIDWGLI